MDPVMYKGTVSANSFNGSQSYVCVIKCYRTYLRKNRMQRIFEDLNSFATGRRVTCYHYVCRYADFAGTASGRARTDCVPPVGKHTRKTRQTSLRSVKSRYVNMPPKFVTKLKFVNLEKQNINSLLIRSLKFK